MGDGDWEADPGYWDTLQFLAWLYSDSQVKDTVVTNDRWGVGVLCKHGDFYTCSDRYNPGILQSHKWENAMTIDKKSWGYRRNMAVEDVFSIEELLKELAITVSCGGNLLMNVGPNKDGVIVPIFEERLRQVVYGILLSWPEDGKLLVGSLIPGTETKVTLLGYERGPLVFKINQQKSTRMTIDLPNLSNSDLKWAWVLKFVHLENGGNTIRGANPF